MRVRTRFDLEREAAKLRTEAFVEDEVPVDLLAICEALDIELRYATLKDVRVAGSSSIENRRAVIYIRPGMDEGLTRFTIAHELGHHYLHIGKGCRDGNPALEREADMFAAALLFPGSVFGGELRKRVSLETVKDLAKRYATSFSAAANHYALCHEEIVAHVVASFDDGGNSVIRYSFESREFQALQLEIQRGRPLPRNSNAHAYITQGVSFGPVLPAKHWFPASTLHQQQRLHEEVLVSRALQEAYILLWIAELRGE